MLELRPTLAPQSVMLDFEKASQIAVSTVFPVTRLVSFVFHLGQSLWRKVQDENLAATYREDKNVCMFVKMLLTLSFVPPADVNTAFEELSEARPDVVGNLYDYWEDNYIGRLRRNRRATPRFPIALWNVRDRVQDNLPRTNNSVERWHHTFQQSIDGHHLNVYKLISHFLREQENTENKILRYNAGERSKAASKTKYLQLNRRLEAILPMYGNKPVMEFLHDISYNLTL
nr:activating transcription factor 7-interacting protein 1 isoform X3 [Biomphalaria glabrata]